MTGDESKFAFLTRRKEGYVTFGDNGKVRIIGHGSIGLDFSMGRLQTDDKVHQQEEEIDSKKEESHFAHPPPPQLEQGESSQELPK